MLVASIWREGRSRFRDLVLAQAGPVRSRAKTEYRETLMTDVARASMIAHEMEVRWLSHVRPSPVRICELLRLCKKVPAIETRLEVGWVLPQGDRNGGSESRGSGAVGRGRLVTAWLGSIDPAGGSPKRRDGTQADTLYGLCGCLAMGIDAALRPVWTETRFLAWLAGVSIWAPQRCSSQP